MNTRLLLITSFLFNAIASLGQVSCPPNVDFENGNYSNWQFYTGVCCPISTPNLTGQLANRHVLTSGNGTDLYGGFPIVAPGGGSYSLKLGNNSTGALAERARYYVQVPNNVNDYSLIYRYAVVFQNPAHTEIEQPRFEVTAYDSATNTIVPCADFSYVATANLPGFTLSPLGLQVWYKGWTTATLNLSGLAGHTIAVDFASGDCAQGGHFGYGYLDMNCALFQILTVNCNGSPTTALSAPPGFQTYTWWDANFTTIVDTGQNAVINTPAVSSQYHVILSPYAGFGCPDTLTTTINVASLNVNATNDTVICSGSSIPLSANATTTSSTINYTWAPSSGLSCTNCANPVATPTSNSTYYLTVTDGNGCSKSDTVQVDIDNLNLSTSTQPTSCNGGSNGTATAIPTTGYPPYSYSWTTVPIQTTSTATGLGAGTYTVTVTDSVGCTKSLSQTISQPLIPLTTSVSSFTNVSCFGNATGNGTVIPVGGVPPYNYSWNTTPVQTSSTASGLGAGTYTVLVTDNQGCTVPQTVTITQPVALNASTSITNIICPGVNNGSATANVTGGTAPYAYSWNTMPIQSTATATGLTAGTYTITITDANGCTKTSSATIAMPATPINAGITSTTPVLCFGGATGLATAAVSGGTAPYNYSWNSVPSQTTATATGLTAGTYIVTITDNNGCNDTAQVTITQPASGVNIALNSTTHVNCNGGTTGNASITATGGVAPYAYSWNTTPVQNSAAATNLQAGTYTVTVTDANGCSKTQSVTITQPALLNAAISSVTNMQCPGSNIGTATVSVTGGSAPFTYLWNTTPTQNTPTASNLPGGTYTVTVTDNHGCSDTAIALISQPATITVSIGVSNLFCSGGTNGSAIANVTGGTAPYAYSWNTTPIQTTATATALTAGTYTVTVTDANGCTKTSSATIAMPSTPINATINSITPVLCFGAATGSATAAATGGTPPYNYYWNSSPFQATATATGLAAGTYTVTVTDNNGCNDTAQVTITQPASALNLALNTTSHVSCYGGANGNTSVTATGGVSPYTYSWNTTPVQNVATATNLQAGTYTVTVTDANGCAKTQSVTITQPPVLNAAVSSVTGALCNTGASGSATVAVTGGSTPFTYSWNTIPAQTGAIASNLPAGTVTVTVTDNQGCSDTAIAVINQPTPLAINISVSNLFCTGGTNGTATANVTGGTAPYAYSWNTMPIQSTATATGLTAGTYTVTITDANGCTKTSSATIAMPATPINAGIASTTPVLCFGGATGSATAAVSGGTAPYNYSWNSVPSQTTATATGLTAGTYIVTITDNNGCNDTAQVTITQPASGVTLSTGNLSNVTCNGGSNGTATVIATAGVLPYSYSWNTIPIQSTPTATNLSAGTYTVSVTDANGCSALQTVTITQPPLLNAGISSVNNILCPGNNIGSATVSVTGGTLPYSYLWNTPQSQTTSTISNLPGGIYTVTVTDNSGCSDTAVAIIIQPAPITISIGVNNLFCTGGTNGSALANVTGGTAPYSYSWNTTPVQTTATATALIVGTYTVTITDANGCTKTSSATIAMPSTPVNASISSVSPAICFGTATGSATATASGGTGPYNYYWNSSPFQATATATVLAAGTYVVTVTDNNGCNDTAHVVINSPFTAINIAVNNASHVTCHDDSNGSALVTASGGLGPYSFSWNNVPTQTTSSATSLTAGTYIVSVTDANGCTATKSVTITQPAKVNASISASSGALCNSSATGSATASVTGGVPAYSYSWNTTPIQTLATANNLVAGTYVVTVSDNNGCSDTAHVAISQPAALAATTNVANLLCIGGNNGSATANITGGTTPYTYSWNTTPLQTSASATSLTAGTYIVNVIDAKGCSITASATIAPPSTPIIAGIGNVTPVICFGAATGSVTATVVGGAAPYNYSWNTTPLQNGATATGLPAGTYIVTVADNNGCSDTASVVIAQPATPVSAVVNNISHPLCSGAATGSATAIGAGGTSSYTYSWNTTPVQNSFLATNLAAGIYTVTVTDAKGCSVNQSVTISQPIPLSAGTSAVNVGCNGNSNGSGSVSVSGGTSPYSYLWNTTPSQTAANATGLAAGTYSVTVTDMKGCSILTSVTISQPTNVVVNTSVTTIFCAGGTGNAIASPTGGTPPYNYSWNTSPVQIAASATNLQPGTYSVTVTDVNGCTATAAATIAPPLPPVTATISGFSNVHCFGGNDGSATVTVTGGTSPYNYSWNTNPGQTSATANGLAAGIYSIIVTDNNGCNDTASVTITEPGTLIVNAQALTKTCIGHDDGSASVSVSGGIAPYSVSWNTNPLQNTSTINKLAPGIYTVIITDNSGCTRTATVNIETYPAANVSAGDDRVICEGESVTLHATGAVSYLWSPADSLSCSACPDPVASPANTLSYSVVGVDINNCRDSDIIEITVLHPKPMAVGPEKKICSGDATELFASGGSTYTWYPSSGLNNSQVASPTASPATTTRYYVVVSQNQCYTDTLEQVVTVYERPTIALGPDHQGLAGSVFQIKSQTTNASSISWTPVSGLSCPACFDPVVTLENSITYTATVSNELGCTAKDQINIRVVCDNSVFFIPNTFTPNGDGNNDLFFPQGKGIKTISSFKVYNRWGEVMYQASNFSPNEINYGWDGRYKGVNLNPDVYVYIISGICQNGDPVSVKGDISLIR